MYHAIVRRKARTAFRQLSEGNAEPVIASFAADGVFAFAGDHALSGELHGPEEVREWFERAFRLLPGLQFEPIAVIAAGPPWNTVVTSRLKVSATLAGGRAYHNEALQLLRLRWGKVIEDRIYEDTQKLAAALDYVAQHGTAEAKAPPLGQR